MWTEEFYGKIKRNGRSVKEQTTKKGRKKKPSKIEEIQMCLNRKVGDC